MLDHEVASRLKAKLGLGEFPLVRERLYSRLQRLVYERGDVPLRIIAEVLQEAHGPKVRDPGRYFCFTVTKRLTVAGLWTQAGSANETQAEVRATVQRLKEKAANPVPAAAVESDEVVYNRVVQQRTDELRRKLAAQEVVERGNQRERLRQKALEQDALERSRTEREQRCRGERPGEL